jgi:hypothetical protein
MTQQEKQELLDNIKYHLALIKDQDRLYTTFKYLSSSIPNDMELGQVIRLLFTSNIK